jgi:hypothetical protein
MPRVHWRLPLLALAIWGLADGALLAAQRPTPEVVIGSLEGDDDAFSEITDVLLVGDSLVLVLDRTEHVVRAFDRAGRLRWRYGRGGGGPGELRWPSRLLKLRDHEVGIVDVARARTTVLSVSTDRARLVHEQAAPTEGPFICGLGRLIAYSMTSSGGSSVSVIDSAGREIRKLKVATVGDSAALARDVVSNSPLGCIEGARPRIVQVDPRSGVVTAAALSGAVLWRRAITPFRGITVRSTGPGSTFMALPPDGYHQPFPPIALPSGRLLLPIQERRVDSMDSTRRRVKFRTMSARVVVLDDASGAPREGITLDGTLRAASAGTIAVELDGEYPRLAVRRAAWAR